MIKTIDLKNRKIEYDLEYKNVKNINLRIKSNGGIYVSANKRVPLNFIEEFILLKQNLILNALEKYKNKENLPQKQYFREDELISFIKDFSLEIYPYFEKQGIKYPLIKFRKMVSCWGVCHTKKGSITFNKNLMYAPKKCVKYVIFHEFIHFLVPNHSDKFYRELEKVCPNWKEYKKALKEISIRQ